MKKRLLVLAMAGIMTASMLTACGGKETAATTAAATETTVAETTAAAETTEAATEATTETTAAAADAADASEDKVITNFDEYISWTNKEWSAANDEEKTNAAIAYSLYATEAITGETLNAEIKALTIAEMKKTDDIKNVISQLDTTLPSFADMSLKDFADTAAEELSKMTETTAAQ